MKLTVEAWAAIVVKEWVKKAAALGISPGSPLDQQRFAHHVITNANGDPKRIEFTFDYYLKFVNWGVGRGVNFENRDILVAQNQANSKNPTTRRRKPWYDDVFYKQLTILGHLMAEKYAAYSIAIVKNTLDNSEKWEKSWHHVDSEGLIPNSTISTGKTKTGKDPVSQYKKVRMK